jgi:hypothetical protein
MGKIRNLVQSAQEREIIKTAPDLVVYLDGLPYINNVFLSANPSNPVIVNFNDYITAFNSNYDVDNMIPTGSFTMTVPAHERYLFQVPGGTNIIQTMMQVQVYAKGYYFASNGNTLFRRVFKGITSHVTHSDDGKTLTITVQIQGIMRLFELMQIDLNPAIQSSAAAHVTAMHSVLWSMNPYSQMAFTFLYPSFTDGFYVNSLKQKTIQNDPYFAALSDGFIAKFQSLLFDICQDSHIYGLQNKEIEQVLKFFNDIAVKSPNKGTKGWSLLSVENAWYSNKKASEYQDIVNVDKIRSYQADHSVGSIQLVNGRAVSRAELLRQITNVINFECFQDIDGQIIIKPPLYNLDVTNLSSSTTASQTYSQQNPNTDINNTNNPFIVHLSEIKSEQETEDEKAVKATRMAIQGNTTVDTQFLQIPADLRGVSEYMDLAKIARYGLRQEPAKTIPWLLDGDIYSSFAQACSEIAVANKGFRTYTFSIPMRPEIHLGFPMYIPHRDMYGYTKNVSISYNQGGGATMTIMLDTLRKRPMYPQPGSGQNGQPNTVFASQPDLVLKWTYGPAVTQQQANDLQNALSISSISNALNNGILPGSSTATPTDPNAVVANLSGQQITLPRPPPNPNAVTGLFINSPITADQNSVLTDQQATYASYYGPSSDTADNAWRIQKDTDPLYATVGTSTASATVAPVESYLPGTGIFVNQRNVNQDYYADVHTTIPYTDGKGYEVIAPFPWGRYIDLKTALQEFTRDGYVVQSEATAAQNTVQTLQNTQTALFAGLDQPTGSADPASSAIAALNTTAGTTNNPPNSSTTKAQFTTVVGTDGSELLGADDKPIMVLQFPQTVLNKANITVFELDYSGFNASSNSTITQGQPDTLLNSELVQNTTTVEQTKLNVFLTGAVVQSGSAIGTQNQALANSGAPQNISKGTATAPPVTAPVVAAPAFSGSVIPG